MKIMKHYQSSSIINISDCYIDTFSQCWPLPSSGNVKHSYLKWSIEFVDIAINDCDFQSYIG